MSDKIKRAQQSWCPVCRSSAGTDCAEAALDRRSAAKRSRQSQRDIDRHILKRLRTVRMLPWTSELELDALIDSDLY